MKKAYSTISFHTKGLDEDQRVIKGVASTPSPDRSNDIVDPLGAQFKLPIPLLSQHDHTKPIGEVIEAKVTKAGIEFTAKIAKGIGYVDEAWAQIKQGLIRGVSIGFRPLEYEEFKNADGYGTNFKRWEWFELSAVTVPANSQATISIIKSLATSGTQDLTKKASPHVSGQSVVSLNPKTKVSMKSISDQIKSFNARHADLAASVQSILAKSADEGRTLDDVEAESHDTAMAEIASVEKHIERLKASEKMAIATATPVDGSSQKAATASRSGGGVISVRSNELPGMGFVKFARCIALSKGNLFQAEALAKSMYPDDQRIQNITKAAVAAGTTSGTTWAAPIADYASLSSEFVEYLRPKTILGRFGQGGIPSLRNIPFNVKINGQTSGSSSFWTGEGAGIGLTKADFNTIYFDYYKAGSIAVLTEELLRFSSPAADGLVRDSMAGALIERLDSDFILASKSAVAGVSPASVTNGLTAVAASGTTADDAKTDLKALLTKFVNAKIGLSQGVFVMHPSLALSLSMQNNALGQPEFPGINMSGGVLLGIPVIVSENCLSTTIVLMAANEIYVALGDVMVDASNQASLEFSDAPTGNSGTPTASSLVSLWQTNSVGLRIQQYANWARRRSDAVAIITGAAYA